MPHTNRPMLQANSARTTKNAAKAKSQRPEIEAEEPDRQNRHGNHADDKAHEAHRHQRHQEFAGAQRAHQQIGEIARPHLLKEREGEALLRAQQNVPQQHRADQRAGQLAGETPRAAGGGKIALEKAPGQHLHHRPIGHLDETRPGRAQQIGVAQHHRADAGEGKTAHETAPLARPRATSRNTSSKVARP